MLHHGARRGTILPRLHPPGLRAHAPSPPTLTGPLLPRSSPGQRAVFWARRLPAGLLQVRARLSKMAPSLAPVSESFPNVEGAPTQQPKPSVTWDLSSPSAEAAAALATTSSGTYPAPAFRQGSRPETRLGAQPQICFLQPRTSQPLVLFRCGAGTQSVRQRELPQAPAPSAGPWRPSLPLPEPSPYLDSI